MKRFWVGLTIFVALAIIAPLFCLLISDGALMPYGGIVMLLVFNLVTMPQAAILEVIHLAVYSPLLFWAAWICSGKICPPATGQIRLRPLLVVLGAILLFGFLPVLDAGHGIYEDLSAYQFYPMLIEKLHRWSRILPLR